MMRYLLREFIGNAKIQEITNRIAKNINIPVHVIDNHGKTLVASHTHKSFQNNHLKFENCIFSERTINKLPMNESFEHIRCQSGFNYILHPIIFREEKLGAFVFGPFVETADFDNLNDEVKNNLNSISKLSESGISTALALGKSYIKILIESCHARFGTSSDEGTATADWEMKLNTGEISVPRTFLMNPAIEKSELVNKDIGSPVNSLHNLVHPEDIEHTKSALNDYLAGKSKSYNTEFRIRTGDEDWKWVRSSGKVVSWDENRNPLIVKGKFVKTNSYSSDNLMTPLSENQFREYAELIPLPAFEMDVDGRILYINSLGFDLFGYENSDLSNEFTCYTVIDHSYHETVRQRINNSVDGDFFQSNEYLFKRKDSSLFTAFVKSSPVLSQGKVIGVRGFLIDITEYKDIDGQKVEIDDFSKDSDQLLIESEEHFRKLFESSSDAIFIISDDKIVDCNNRATELFSCTKELLTNSSPSDFSPFLQADSKRSSQKFSKLLKNTIAGNQQEFEWQFIRPDSSSFLADVSLNAFETSQRSVVMCSVRDISYKKFSEEQLKKSENLFKGIFEKNRAIMLLLDSKTNKIKDANLAAEQFYGINRKKLKTMNFKQLSIYPEERTQSDIRSLIDGDRSQLSSKHRTHSGDIRDVEIYLTSLTSLDNKEVFFIIIHDITERKRAEQTLRENELLFRLLFEKSGDANFLIRENKFVDCNDLALDMIGAKSKNQVINMEPHVFSPEIQPDGQNSEHKENRLFAEAYEKGFLRFEWMHKRFDGAILPTEVTLTAIPIRGELLLHATWRDISTKKNALDKVYEQQEFLREIIDLNPSLIYVKDENGKFMLVNQAVADIYGTDVLSIIGKSDADFNNNADEVAHFIAEDFKVIKDRQARATIEEPVTSSDGQTRWFMTTKKPITMKDGSVRLLGVSTEITKRRLAEEALRLSEEKLKLKLDFILSPEKEISDFNITDLIDVHSLQQIQDSFALATGVSSLITDKNGIPVTEPSNFSEVCQKIRSSEKGLHKCIKSDKILGEISKANNKPTYQECLSCGFIDAHAPIIVAGKHIGNWLIGQTNALSVDEGKIREFAHEIELSEEELIAAFKNMPQMSLENFEKVLKLLWDLAREISILGYNNLRLARYVEDLRKTETSLTLSHENLSVTLDSIGDAVIVTDEKGCVTRMNPIAELLTGWTLEDALGKQLTEVFNIINAITGAKADNPVDRVIKFGEIVGLANHTELISRSGKRYQIADSAAPIKTEDGSIIGIVMVFRDVTEKYQQEQQIRLSEEKYRRAFNLSPEAIVLIGKDGVIHEINSKVCQWLGTTREEIINKKFHELGQISEDSRRIMANKLSDRLTYEVQPEPYEIEFTSAAGVKQYGLLMSSAINDDSGNLEQVLVMISNITERKKNEIVQDAVYQIAIATNNTSDIGKLSLEIQCQLGRLMDTTNFFIAQYNKETDSLSLPYFVDEADTVTSFPAGKTMTSYVVKNDIAVLADKNDIRKLVDDGKVEIVGTPSKKWLGVPLKIGSNVLGALVVQSYHDEDAYNTSHLKILQYASEQIAIALERKYVEQMLIDSEKKYRTLTDGLPVGVYRTSKKGKILYANPALLSILEYDSFEDISRITPRQTYVSERNTEFQLEIWKQSGNSIVSNEMQLYTKTGRMIWARDTFAITLDELGDILYFDGAIEDITESKYAEDSLRRSEANLAEAQRIARLGSWSMNAMTNEVFWSDEVYSVFGLDKDKDTLQPSLQVIFDVIHPDDIDYVQKKLNEALKSKTPFNFEHRMLRPNKTEAYILTRGEITCDLHGQPVWVFGTFQDISDQKIAQEEIKKLNEALENRVRERTMQLENTLIELQYENEERKRAQDALFRANDEIGRALEKEKELSELKTRFMSMISHEYRTPLTVILNSTYVIEKLYQGSRFSDFSDYLSKIRVSIKGMTSLLEEVLLIGKSEAGKLTYHPAYLNIISLCKGIIEEIRVIDKNQHEIIFSHDVATFETETDEKLLRQIISNLLSNATKYSPVGNPVKIEFDSGMDEYKLKIIDKGIGIMPEDQKHLFDPFHRGANIGAISGTGLGLSIVNRCVTILGGTVECESHVGFGTKFTIVIPKKMEIS